MTEGLKKRGLARQPSCVLVPSDSWQYEVWGGEGKGEEAWVFKIPAALWRKMFLEPRAAIWLVLVIWVQRLQECGRRCQEKREQPQHAVCGLLDTGQVSSGHREATARGLGVSFCEPVSHRVTRQLPWPPQLRKLKAFPYPGWVHAILLECPWAVWVEFLGSSSAQQKCKHRPRDVIKQHRVPKLETYWVSSRGWGCVGNNLPAPLPGR